MSRFSFRHPITTLVSVSATMLLAVGGASAITLRAEGIDSGLVATSPTILIADAAPIGDPLEFRVFYAANAADGTTMDYDGLDPILESDLVDDAAHLFVLEKSGDLALFVVYKRAAGTQSADATLAATGGDFALADILVQDATSDTYTIVAGDIVTSHRITESGRTDGYVAALAGRFEVVGDELTFDFATPASGTSDLAFTSIQVYTGLDGSGDPTWFEIDSGPYSSSTPRSVEFTILAPVPSMSRLATTALVASLIGLSIGLATRRGSPCGLPSASDLRES